MKFSSIIPFISGSSVVEYVCSRRSMRYSGVTLSKYISFDVHEEEFCNESMGFTITSPVALSIIIFVLGATSMIFSESLRVMETVPLSSESSEYFAPGRERRLNAVPFTVTVIVGVKMMNGTLASFATSKYASPLKDTSRLSFLKAEGKEKVEFPFIFTEVPSGSMREDVSFKAVVMVHIPVSTLEEFPIYNHIVPIIIRGTRTEAAISINLLNVLTFF